MRSGIVVMSWMSVKLLRESVVEASGVISGGVGLEVVELNRIAAGPATAGAMRHDAFPEIADFN